MGDYNVVVVNLGKVMINFLVIGFDISDVMIGIMGIIISVIVKFKLLGLLGDLFIIMIILV